MHLHIPIGSAPANKLTNQQVISAWALSHSPTPPPRKSRLMLDSDGAESLVPTLCSSCFHK